MQSNKLISKRLTWDHRRDKKRFLNCRDLIWDIDKDNSPNWKSIREQQPFMDSVELAPHFRPAFNDAICRLGNSHMNLHREGNSVSYEQALVFVVL